MKHRTFLAMAFSPRAMLLAGLCAVAPAGQALTLMQATPGQATPGQVSAQGFRHTVELYGAVRLSADYVESDVSRVESKTSAMLSEGDFGISSNTSYIGFRGRVSGEGRYAFLWQIDQQVDLDDRDPGDVFATRDSFIGLASPVGTFLVGYVNTPFKNMGVRFVGPFNVTIADSHAIFGAPSSGAGGRIDRRSGNSVTWRGTVAGVAAELQYSADHAGTVNTADDNGRNSVSGSLAWRVQDLELSGAFVKFAEAPNVGKVDAWRVAARYHLGKLGVGVMYEDIDAHDRDVLSRAAYGLQLRYALNPRWSLAAQWNHAQESEAGDDGADQYSVAAFRQLNSAVQLHAAATMTRNDANAAYRVMDYGHGDKVGTLPGREPFAVSVGARLMF